MLVGAEFYRLVVHKLVENSRFRDVAHTIVFQKYGPSVFKLFSWMHMVM